MAKSTDMKSRLLSLAGRSAARLVAHVRDTSTIVAEPAEGFDPFEKHHPFIMAMWHGQFLMLPARHTTDDKVAAMVARHGDAEVIGEVLTRFNISLVRGAGAGDRAKDRGGAQALRTALKLLKGGSTLCMTADVPPGPARRAGLGIVTLARMSGRPIIPYAAATTRYLALNTWSRMTIALPYGKLAFAIGRPIWVPRDASEEELEKYRVMVEEGMNATTERAFELAESDPKRATPPSQTTAKIAKPGLKLRLYRRLASLGRPLAPAILAVRERQGKEDRNRRSERFGETNIARPEGALVWVHAASVGETNAVLPLMDRLLKSAPHINFLLTTGTTTSAHLAEQRLPKGSIHQYLPLDAPEYARRFLDHWQPDLAIFTESEIWPNLILETHARTIPLAIINARMSPRSLRRWAKNPGLSAPLFGRFNVVLAQNDRLARNFRILGAPNVIVSGNLKIDAPPPPVDATALDGLKAALKNRPVFLATSTHDGEEDLIADVHRTVARNVPGLCTIIAPRHPERGPAIAENLKAKGLVVDQRSLGELPADNTEIYLSDTIGELGTLYALTRVAFIGGSLVDRGGQNPIEPIAHGVAVITGPHTRNFRDTYRTLLRHKGAIEIQHAGDLPETVTRLLKDANEQKRLGEGARVALLTLGGALEKTAEALEPLLPKPEGLKRAS